MISSKDILKLSGYFFLEEIDLLEGYNFLLPDDTQRCEILLGSSIWLYLIEFFFQGEFEEKEE